MSPRGLLLGRCIPWHFASLRPTLHHLSPTRHPLLASRFRCPTTYSHVLRPRASPRSPTTRPRPPFHFLRQNWLCCGACAGLLTSALRFLSLYTSVTLQHRHEYHLSDAKPCTPSCTFRLLHVLVSSPKHHLPRPALSDCHLRPFSPSPSPFNAHTGHSTFREVPWPRSTLLLLFSNWFPLPFH